MVAGVVAWDRLGSGPLGSPTLDARPLGRGAVPWKGREALPTPAEEEGLVSKKYK